MAAFSEASPSPMRPRSPLGMPTPLAAGHEDAFLASEQQQQQVEGTALTSSPPLLHSLTASSPQRPPLLGSRSGPMQAVQSEEALPSPLSPLASPSPRIVVVASQAASKARKNFLQEHGHSRNSSVDSDSLWAQDDGVSDEDDATSSLRGSASAAEASRGPAGGAGSEGKGEGEAGPGRRTDVLPGSRGADSKRPQKGLAVSWALGGEKLSLSKARGGGGGGGAEGDGVPSPDGAVGVMQAHGLPKAPLSPSLLTSHSPVSSTRSDTLRSSSPSSTSTLSLGSSSPLAHPPSSSPDTLAAPVSPVKVPAPTVKKKFFSQQFARRPVPASSPLISTPPPVFGRSSLAEQHAGDDKPSALTLSSPAAFKRRDGGLFANISRLVRSKDDLDTAVGHPMASADPDAGAVMARSKSLAECLREVDEDNADEEEEGLGEVRTKAPSSGRMEGLSRPSIARIGTAGAATGAGGAGLPPIRPRKGKSSVWSSAATLLQRSKRAGMQQTAEEAGRAAAAATAGTP